MGGPKAESFDQIEHKGTANIAIVSAKMGVERLTYISGATVAEENAWFPMI